MFSIQVTLFIVGRLLPLNGNPTLVLLALKHVGLTLRLEPPLLVRVMLDSGQRISFQSLSSTTSVCATLVHDRYDESLVVNDVPDRLNPPGFIALRARVASEPFTHSWRLWVPAGTLARQMLWLESYCDQPVTWVAPLKIGVWPGCACQETVWPLAPESCGPSWKALESR